MVQQHMDIEPNELSSIERINICRHPKRPKSVDYIKHVFKNFEEIHGDRLFRDDPSIICGFGYLGEIKCAIIAQEKGSDTDSRLKHNFGMNFPEGYRKALRVMKLAEKFSLPIICLIDTPGAYPGLEAEERGQGHAIAQNLKEMSLLKTPTISLVIAEGCSGGALGIGVTDRIFMLEHSYYSVISPEGCASILWKDPSKKELASSALKLHPEDLIGLHIIDKMIKEPHGGAHLDPRSVFSEVKKVLAEEISYLKTIPIQELLQQRYEKFRRIGSFL